MENDDFLKDDYLHRLISQSPLDSPSDNFVDNIMTRIQLAPEVAAVKKPFFLSLKEAVPYVICVLLLLVVFATSDLPFMNWFPGKDFFIKIMVPYFGTIFTGLKIAFASRFVSFGLLICLSAGLLFFIDRFFSRRTTV